MAHQECRQKFLQKSRRKNIPFLDDNIPYLEGGMRGRGSGWLTKKAYPMLFLKILGHPCHHIPMRCIVHKIYL